MEDMEEHKEPSGLFYLTHSPNRENAHRPYRTNLMPIFLCEQNLCALCVKNQPSHYLDFTPSHYLFLKNHVPRQPFYHI